MNKSATLRRYRPTALLILVLYLAGCYAWQPVTVSPRQFIEEERPEHIRIIQSDGTRTGFINPRVAGDSVVVILSRYQSSGEMVIIALTDITSIEVRRINSGATLAVGAMLLAFRLVD